MSSMRRLMSFALLLATVLGCSDGNPKTYEVRGAVRFPDGLPLTAGTIEFQSLAHETPFTATGEISTDGTYKLGTFDIEDGAVEGRHRVVIVASHEIGTGVERPGELEPTKLHPRFGDYRTSGLEFEVKRGKNEFQIPVEYAPRSRR